MNVWLTTLNYVLYSDALLSTYVDSGRRRIKKDGTICQAYGGRSSKGMNKSTNTDILMATISFLRSCPYFLFLFEYSQNADWIKSSAAKFDPEKNTVTTTNGDEISYEYMVVSVGLQLRYDQVNSNFS